MRPPFCRNGTEEKCIFPLYKPGKACYNILVKKLCTGGSMDRASDSGSEGWGFESLPVYQTVQIRTFYQLVKGSDLLFILLIPHKANRARSCDLALFLFQSLRLPPNGRL